MVINLLVCGHDLKDGAGVLSLEANFRLFVVMERMYLYRCICTKYMFARRLWLLYSGCLRLRIILKEVQAKPARSSAQRWKQSGSWKVRWGYHNCHKHLRDPRGAQCGGWRAQGRNLGLSGLGGQEGVSPRGFPSARLLHCCGDAGLARGSARGWQRFLHARPHAHLPQCGDRANKAACYF